MTSIPLILHYQPTLHLLTNLIQFCLILPGPYILTQNLNPPGPYILGRREYTNKEYFLYFTFPFLRQVYNDSTSYIWIRSLGLVYNPSTAA
jgi:hypothetical protein